MESVPPGIYSLPGLCKGAGTAGDTCPGPWRARMTGGLHQGPAGLMVSCQEQDFHAGLHTSSEWSCYQPKIKRSPHLSNSFSFSSALSMFTEDDCWRQYVWKAGSILTNSRNISPMHTVMRSSSPCRHTTHKAMHQPETWRYQRPLKATCLIFNCDKCAGVELVILVSLQFMELRWVRAATKAGLCGHTSRRNRLVSTQP